jgi:ATP-dependent Clp protease ATP-binding subunit ClpA
MNAAYLTALAALFGSAVGGFTSLATTWLTQHGQAKMQQLTKDRVQRETLFAAFIDEASMLYADAFEHEGTDLSKLSKLFAMISRMRLLSSQSIIEHAEDVSHKIVDTYLAPNKTFRDVVELRKNGALDPLRKFSEACREELRRFGG